MNQVRAEDGLRTLSELAAEREHAILQYPSTIIVESDVEAGSECPIFDTFHGSGSSESILKTCNLTPSEFPLLYSELQVPISENWNVGRGKRSDFKPMDVLFMTLVVMKHGTSCDTIGHIFKINWTTLLRLVSGFMEKNTTIFY